MNVIECADLGKRFRRPWALRDWLVALSVILIAASVWLVRRRAAGAGLRGACG